MNNNLSDQQSLISNDDIDFKEFFTAIWNGKLTPFCEQKGFQKSMTCTILLNQATCELRFRDFVTLKAALKKVTDHS